MKTIFLSTDGSFERREIENTLEKAVGGDIEVVPLPTEGDFLIVDEEGRLKGKPLNKMATLLARRTIVGDALIVSKQGEDFGDADPVFILLLGRFRDGLAGVQLSAYEPVKLRVDYNPKRSKEGELAIQAWFNEDETIENLRKMICICTNELMQGVHLTQKDVYLYCIAMGNLIESLENIMDQDQRKKYERIKESLSLTTFIDKGAMT